MKQLDDIEEKYKEFMLFRPELNLEDTKYELDLLNTLYLVKEFRNDEIVSVVFSRPLQNNYFIVNGLVNSFPVNKAFRGSIVFYKDNIVIDLIITKLFNNREYNSLTELNVLDSNVMLRTTYDNHKSIDYINGYKVSLNVLRLDKKSK